MMMWIRIASELGEFSCSQAVEMKASLSAWGAVEVGGTTHSCSEFCLCGIGLGPNYCTFCRLSPINGHFLDQSSLLRSFLPLWLHLSQSRHSVGWRNARPWGRRKDIFRQDGSHVSLTTTMRGTWRLFSVLFRLFLSCWEYQTHIKLCWYGGGDLERKFYFQTNTWERTFFSFWAWPLFPNPVAAWLSHTHSHLFCSCSKKETGMLSSTGAAPGLSCLYIAFGTHFSKHSAYFQISPWDSFFFFFPKEKHSPHSHLHLGTKMEHSLCF